MRVSCLTLLGAAVFAPALSAQPAVAHLGQSLEDLSTSLEALSATVRPGVVQIFSTGYATPQDSDSTNASSLLSQQRSTGSGVILSADGYIITNNHVVQAARRIEVRLPAASRTEARESTVPAKVVGTDREADLAVLKIDRTGLPFLTLGDSNDLKQGQVVMAFGNPLGLEGSVSMGIVSSIARRLRPDDTMVYVQTDAPINPGNSGGPLVDTAGHVVGINTFILTQSGGSEGLGFAIPSNSVRNVYEQIRKDGHVHRGQIGVVVQTITSSLAKGLALPQDWGVIASDVIPDGPADKAGLKVGDIILTANERTMEDAPQLETVIRRSKLAEMVHVTVLRGGDHMDYNIQVIEREDDPQRFADMVNPDDNLIDRLGILGIEINAQLSAMLPDLRHDYGVVVAARSANPPYSGEALEVGDVIYQIGGMPTITVKSIRDKLDGLKMGDVAVLQIERAAKLMYITVEVE